MGILVDKSKCNGCKGLAEPRCVQACPGNLMDLNPVEKKSYIRDQGDCWDCLACVKQCPVGALETKLPYQLAQYKASLKPKVYKDRIEWTCIDINGKEEKFTIKTLEV